MSHHFVPRPPLSSSDIAAQAGTKHIFNAPYLYVKVVGIQDQDDDTKTAIGIDNDTITARHLIDDDSSISTCHNILSDTRTVGNIVSDVNTARDINDKGWFEYIFDFLFPIGSAEDSNGIHQRFNHTEFMPCGAAAFGRK
uniref:Uncharacterized protein n=1 Tax=Panagrolaimus superbus TaxID=310955 RepID=A0A914Y8N7_9BILA